MMCQTTLRLRHLCTRLALGTLLALVAGTLACGGGRELPTKKQDQTGDYGFGGDQSNPGDTGPGDTGGGDSGPGDTGTPDDDMPPDEDIVTDNDPPPADEDGDTDPGDTGGDSDPFIDTGVELNGGWVGGACTSAASCDDISFTDTAVCQSSGFPSGMCTQSCYQSTTTGNWLCPDAASYGPGTGNTITRCVADAANNPQCVAGCDFDQSPTGCRPGYACVLRARYGGSEGIFGVCLPRETDGWPGEVSPSFDIGNSCTADEQCGYLSCLTTSGGYCTKTMCDSAPCPDGSTCVDIAEAGVMACMRDCVASSQCRQSDGESCQAPGVCWGGLQ